MRILIIEDQESLAKLIKEGLKSEGFSADYVLDGSEGESRINLNHKDYDLVILDINLPQKDGINICKSWRNQNITIPILMLTAKDSTADIVDGFNAGADDYLTKPFSIEVLVAHIRAILRRPKNVLPVELKTKDITLNPVLKKVKRNNKEIKLTLKEFGLLECLMRSPNQVISREQIISNVWDFAFDTFSNVVDVHITNIRKKINDKKSKIIETVHGVGYRINDK